MVQFSDTIVSALQSFPLIGVWIAIGIFGLIIGSFLNVVIYRYPRMLEQRWQVEIQQFLLTQGYDIKPVCEETPALNLAYPASHCPHCQRKLTVWELFPVLSWLLLRGRCHSCQTAISWRYPLVECITAALFVVPVMILGCSFWTLALMPFSALLLCASLIDIDRMWLPDGLTQPLLWLGLLVAASGAGLVDLNQALIGVICGYVLLWSVAFLYRHARGQEGLGSGDSVLFAALGSWVGPQALMQVLLLAALGGILFALIVRRFHQPQPFGCWLAAAGWIVLIMQSASPFLFG